MPVAVIGPVGRSHATGQKLRDGQLQRRTHQLRVHARRHRPAHHLAGVQVQHHRQVQEAAALADVGDVAHPGLVGAARVGAPGQHIGRDRQRVAAVGGVDELAPPQGPQPVLAHQTPHPVASNVQPLHRAKATAAIDTAAGGERGLQLRADQAGLGCELGALTGTVVARTADAQNAA